MTGVNELFQSIRFLKLMGWEGGWTERSGLDDRLWL